MFCPKGLRKYIVNVNFSPQHFETHKIILKPALEVILYTKEKSLFIEV